MSGVKESNIVQQMRPVAVHEIRSKYLRNSKYAAVYAELHRLGKLDPPQGALVPFNSVEAGTKAITLMTEYAAEDGNVTLYFHTHDKEHGGRFMWIEHHSDQESEDESAADQSVS